MLGQEDGSMHVMDMSDGKTVVVDLRGGGCDQNHVRRGTFGLANDAAE